MNTNAQQPSWTNHRLTTAEIIYHLPDHPHLLQSFVWQYVDTVPDYPGLKKFLAHWERIMDGKIHSVTIASAETLRPAAFQPVDYSISIH